MLQPSAINVQTGLGSHPVLSDETFLDLRDYIYQRTGIFYPEKKKYLLEGRLGKRLKLLKMRSFEDYLQLLKYGHRREQEFEFLCDAVTIAETSFFRNEPQFDAFEHSLVPELVVSKRRQGLPRIRIWSAACSTGEEPYTLAMLYLEKLRPRFPDLSLEILATDISGSVLQAALKGLYSDYSIRNLPPLYLGKYLQPVDGRYQVRDELRQFVKFQLSNLFDRQQMRALKNFDIILCRNVLIYFDMKAKIQVVADLYNSLNHGGYLFIGYSELLHGISTAFKITNFAKTVAYKKE